MPASALRVVGLDMDDDAPCPEAAAGMYLQVGSQWFRIEYWPGVPPRLGMEGRQLVESDNGNGHFVLVPHLSP